MDNKTLEIGTKLVESITKLKKQKDYWERSVRVNMLQLKTTAGGFPNVDADYIDFNVLKVLTLEAINNKLSLLETEFKNLKPE